MIRRVVVLLVLLTGFATAGAGETFHALAYHDIRDDVARDVDHDQYAVSTEHLIAHFTWLRANGYQPVSLDDILAARAGVRALPDKAVLLTFDDGLKSAYTHVFPLLKLFEYPAFVSVVTGWIDTDEPVRYADRARAAEGFISWAEAKEMQASGLVEIASHSFDLHRGIRGNPQGNLQPAAVTRYFDGTSYESTATYRARIATDIGRSVAEIRSALDRAPRVLAWPFGKYNAEAVAIAAAEGLGITMSLEEGVNLAAGTQHIRRHLVIGNPGIRDFASMLLRAPRTPVVRMAQVDLDYVYDADAGQQNANLDALLDRIKALEISHVFLQAFADPDSDGAADAVYFPNRHLPVRADLFNRVAWQLTTRSGVEVYAWMPLLGFVSEDFDPSWRVMEFRDGQAGLSATGEPRLSPFQPEARQKIIEIYADLAAHASFNGILFHDDGRLNEFEDANPRALEYYRERLGADFSIARALLDEQLNARWAQVKSTALIDFSHDLAAAVRNYRPAIKTARNLFPAAALDPKAETWLAQSFSAFLGSYDYVALMAMPYLENEPDPDAFFDALVKAVAAHPGGTQRTIFELQTVDWRDNSAIPAAELKLLMRRLQALGVRHIGYYPDDFILGKPELELLRQGISLAEYPYRR